MEYCPYDSAFEILIPKDERKRKKKQKKANLELLETDFETVDPDRPAFAQKNEVLSLHKITEAFQDISSNIVVPAQVSELKPLPKYFLRNDDELEEGFQNNDTVATTTTSSVLPSTSSVLPLNDNWKPVTSSNSYTAFFDTDTTKLPVTTTHSPVRTTIPKTKTQQQQPQQPQDIASKIDILFQRLDALEKECKGVSLNNPNNQKEILYFVGTGFVFLLGLHLLHK